MQNKKPHYKKQLQTKFTMYLINIHGNHGVNAGMGSSGIQIVGSW